MIVLLVGNSQLIAGTVKAQQLNQSITTPPRILAVRASYSPITKVNTYIKPITYKRSIYCNCKAFLEASGIKLPRTLNGHARTLPVNSNVPSIGAVVVTNEGRFGHLAHVDDIVDNYLILNEANYVRCQQTKGRKLSIDSPLIIGYYVK